MIVSGGLLTFRVVGLVNGYLLSIRVVSGSLGYFKVVHDRLLVVGSTVGDGCSNVMGSNCPAVLDLCAVCLVLAIY